MKKVMKTVLDNKLLSELGSHEHNSFKNMKLNPLHKWDVDKTKKWIKAKMKEYEKYRGSFRAEVSQSDIEEFLSSVDAKPH